MSKKVRNIVLATVAAVVVIVLISLLVGVIVTNKAQASAIHELQRELLALKDEEVIPQGQQQVVYQVGGQQQESTASEVRMELPEPVWSNASRIWLAKDVKGHFSGERWLEVNDEWVFSHNVVFFLDATCGAKTVNLQESLDQAPDFYNDVVKVVSIFFSRSQYNGKDEIAVLFEHDGAFESVESGWAFIIYADGSTSLIDSGDFDYAYPAEELLLP
jgi:hypothetical protein